MWGKVSFNRLLFGLILLINIFLYRYKDDPIALYNYLNRYLINEAKLVSGVTLTEMYSLKDVLDLFLHCFQADSDFRFKDNQYDTRLSANFAKRAVAAAEVPVTDEKENLILTAKYVKPNPNSYLITHQLNNNFLYNTGLIHCRSVSNMWPYAQLPMAIHSVYWLKKNSCPCLCVGLDVNAWRNNVQSITLTGINANNSYIKIIPLDCTTPRRMSLVTPSALETYKWNLSSSPLLKQFLNDNSKNMDSLVALTENSDTKGMHKSTNVKANSAGNPTPSRVIESATSKTVDFANAMIDFAVYKLQQKQYKIARKLNDKVNSCFDSDVPFPDSEVLCKWFMYPKFIHLFFEDIPAWNKWRKQAERKVLNISGTGNSKYSTRELYFFALLETDKLDQEAQRDALLTQAAALGIVNTHESLDDATMSQNDNLCIYLNSFEWGYGLYMLKEYPWDDSLLFLGVDYQYPGNDAGTSDMLDNNQEKVVPADRERYALSVKKRKAVAVKPIEPIAEEVVGKSESHSAKKRTPVSTPKAVKAPPPPPPPPAIDVSPINLYWLRLNQLPCIYYDDAGKEKSEKFYVLPINCETFQYYTLVNRRQVQPLSEHNVLQCTDDKTREFACALMDFAQWDIQTAEAEGGEEADPDEVYQWPDFILNLITNAKEWAVWRKHAFATYSTRSTPCSLRSAYFQQLRSEYLKICESESVD